VFGSSGSFVVVSFGRKKDVKKNLDVEWALPTNKDFSFV
jgi:hypothetical protein